MTSLPFFLVTGFLGSGKTSFLKHVLEEWADTRRLAVVQNEFAETGVDGAELRRTGKPFHLEEIDKGSAFCVCLLSDFHRILRRVLDGYKPDAVVLETAGLADPIAVVQTIQTDALEGRLYLAHAVCLVDASNFLEWEPRFPSLSRQIRVADTVAINKTDLAPDTVRAVRERVFEINPIAHVACTKHGKIPLKRIHDSAGFLPVALQHSSAHRRLKPYGRPCIGSAVIKTTNPISMENLRSFIETAAVNTYRIKGTVRLSDGKTVAVQSCFGRTKMRCIGLDHGPTELVVLGPNVTRREWTRRYLQCTMH